MNFRTSLSVFLNAQEFGGRESRREVTDQDPESDADVGEGLGLGGVGSSDRCQAVTPEHLALSSECVYYVPQWVLWHKRTCTCAVHFRPL